MSPGGVGYYSFGFLPPSQNQPPFTRDEFPSDTLLFGFVREVRSHLIFLLLFFIFLFLFLDTIRHRLEA